MELTLNEADKKLYSRLYVSGADIDFAQYCGSVILKKGWHRDLPGRRGWGTYQQQVAFTTALVTTYGRLFTRSNGWPKLPEDLVTVYSGQEQALHKKLITLRNTVYAHSDSVSHSVRPWRSKDFSTDIIKWLPLRLTLEEATLFQEMSSKLRASIGERMNVILSKYP